jgi:hypothetical protein
LHRNLEECYPGNENNFKEIKKAGMKIHTIYNLSKEKFDSFELSSFRKNDQKASPDILGVAGKDDLIIRDLGYFVIDTLKEITGRGIYYITRYHRGAFVLNKENQSRIDLVKLIKKQRFVDIDVLLGVESKFPCRLVAIPMTNQAAATKRRKAKNNRDRRLKPDSDAIFLMGWMIYITNLDRKEFSSKEIFVYYRLRWRIETLFKSWKSCFRITDIEELSNKIMVDNFIYQMLLFITLFQISYSKFSETNRISQGNNRPLSIIKYAEFVNNNLLFIIASAIRKTTPVLLEEFVNYYCNYESRNKRNNFSQSLNLLG